MYFLILIVFYIQVKNPEKYGFDPKTLLCHIVDIYIHLSSVALARAVADDQRSYTKDLFDTCARLLEKIGRRPKVSSSYLFCLAVFCA